MPDFHGKESNSRLELLYLNYYSSTIQKSLKKQRVGRKYSTT